MAQQTAVEWLQQIELTRDLNLGDWEKAKQMEMEKAIRDYNTGYDDAQCNHINDAENYVNEQKYLNNK